MYRSSFYLLVLTVLVLSLNSSGYSGTIEVTEANYVTNTKPLYSTVEEFREKLEIIVGIIKKNKILAYADTLEDGYPDPKGKTFPLIDFINTIIEKIDNNELDSAVNDIYHFDDSPFSLISYLMKANMVGSISAQKLTEIAVLIPLPPIIVESFSPPLVPVVNPVIPPPPCPCKPKIKIKVTWTYRPACGNYTRKTSGYAANNTLTNMRRGALYRVDAEVEGCSFGSNVVSDVTTTASSIGYSKGSGGKTITLISESSGSIKITFTYKCGCGCSLGDSETFNISF